MLENIQNQLEDMEAEDQSLAQTETVQGVHQEVRNFDHTNGSDE